MNSIILYLIWPYYYVRGMMEYDYYNPVTLKNLEQAVHDEKNEYFEAKNVSEKILEGFDVIHTMIRLYSYKFGISSFFVKILCCIFSPCTSMKHGLRYANHGCIRNHPHCLAKKHNCCSK